MSTNLVDISLAIKTKLQGVGGLHDVYEYEPSIPTNGKYPFATVTLGSFSGEFGSTTRNLRKQEFVVRVYQERTEKGFGNNKAERITRELLDEIITAFDNDTTLSGMVKMITPISGDLSYDDRETGDTRVAEITLEALTVVDSN